MDRREVLAGWLKENKINRFAMDVDDTLAPTGEMILGQMHLYVSTVVRKLSHLNEEEVFKRLEQVNNQTFKTMHVRVERWDVLAESLAEEYEAKEFLEHAHIFSQIYTTAPDMFPGAYDLLTDLKEIGTPVSLVTHATEDWTNRKIDKWNIRSLIDDVVVVPVDRFKGQEDWRFAADRRLTPTGEMVAMGDNLRADIVASHAVGYKHQIYLPSSWAIYREGEVPEGTIIAKNILEVVSVLKMR